jgi:recombination protein RecR
MKYPLPIEKLMRALQRLPGVGRRTAERYAFDLALDWEKEELDLLQGALSDAKEHLTTCPICGALKDGQECFFCQDTRRRKDLLAIVATAREVFALEATGEYRGQYHVLGSLLSPLDGRGDERLRMAPLFSRLQKGEIKEVVFALDSTLEGDATALFLKEQLEPFSLSISRLAFGIPVGSSLEYVDGGTLARAFLGRATF